MQIEFYRFQQLGYATPYLYESDQRTRIQDIRFIC